MHGKENGGGIRAVEFLSRFVLAKNLAEDTHDLKAVLRVDAARVATPDEEEDDSRTHGKAASVIR